MSYVTIPDAMVTEFAPVTGRLSTRLNRNARAVGVHSLDAPGTVQAQTALGTFQTIFALRFFSIFDTNLRVNLRLFTQHLTSLGQSRFRIQESATGEVSAEATNTIATGAPSTPGIAYRDFSVEFLSAANTVRVINCQALSELSGGSSQAKLGYTGEWDTNDEANMKNYFEVLGG